jgi:hypothetical protein
LAPIAVDQPQKAAQLGIRWGLGHGLGVVALGGLGIFARASIHVDTISAWSEFMVGAVLIFVGLWAFRSASRMVIHDHAHGHEHAEPSHTHYHVHANSQHHDAASSHRGHSHAAFSVGLLHGAAGTGHLLGVLPSLAFPPLEAGLYLSAYFVAAVASMAGFGRLMGALVKNRGPYVLRRVMYGASSLALVVGTFWMGHAWPS